MLSLYDRLSMEQALTLPLDRQLHDLLARRIASLSTADGDLGCRTHFLVIDRTTNEAEIVDEIGLSVLIDPNGYRFGSDHFVAWWDYLAKDHTSSLWEIIICVADSGFAYHLIIHPDADPVLLALCEEYAE